MVELPLFVWFQNQRVSRKVFCFGAPLPHDIILDIFTHSPCKVKEGWKFVEDPDRNFYDIANSWNTLVEAPNKAITGSLF
jgi:hypothetical protein